VLGPFDTTPVGFLGRSGAPQAMSLAMGVDPTSASSPGVAASSGLLAGGQLTTDLTAIGTGAVTPTSGASDTAAGAPAQTTPVTGAGLVLSQPDSAGPIFTNPSQPLGRFGPGA
jgi:hypothetical protein